MSLILITTRNHQQKAFWDHRLQQSFPDMQYAVLVEDWPGGAGNGLGTLYAFQQASEVFNEDLFELLKNGTSIALYHCAGEGQRLYPISASEHNNKSALKLPGVITCEKKEIPITLLEAILKQTEPYVTSNPGRLSVFWGDQLFFPTAKPTHQHNPVDIYVKPLKFPTKHEWEVQHLDRYGIVLLGMEGQGSLLEKPHYDEITQLLAHGAVNMAKGVNLSLGSFSISADLLKALTAKFEHEISQKKGKLDTDPHFWMPLSLPLPLYTKLMTAKGDNPSHVEKHWHRMQDLRTQKNILGIVDLGSDCSWWDFGSIQIYVNNLLKMLENTEESQRIRKFLHMPSSGILNSHIKKSKVVNSVVVDTEAEELNIQNSIVIGSHLSKLQCSNCLYYNVHTDEEIKDTESNVKADVSGKTYTAPIQSDPKKNWNVVLPGNPMSWKDLHNHLEHRN